MEYQQKPKATITLVVIQVAVFLLLSFGGMTEDAYYMSQHGAMYVPDVLAGQYYTLFTSMFLHFGFTHLLNNMASFLIIGWNLEPTVGPWKVLLIFIVSGLGGNVASVLYDIVSNTYYVSAGASGAIFGLTGALLCMAIKNRGRVGNVTPRGMVIVVVVSLYLGFSSQGVDNAAHVGGLVTGFLFALLFCRKRNANQGFLIYD